MIKVIYFYNIFPIQVEAKVRDVYLKFERSCVWTLIENVASEAWACAAAPPPPHAHAHADSPRIATDAQLHTTAALFTPQDANLLVSTLQKHPDISASSQFIHSSLYKRLMNEMFEFKVRAAIYAGVHS